MVHLPVYEKILLATDGSENAIRAAEQAAELTKRFEAEATLITSVYIPPMYTGDVAELEEALLEDGARLLDDTKKVFVRKGASCATKLVRWVHPVEAICTEAVDGKYDLIVLGSRGLAEAKRGLLGSVSEGVLRSSPCAVLMVK
jgi:nucleotide-binding universal stress UspA family protein